MFVDELFDGVPEGRNGGFIFVEGDGKAIDFFLILHDQEGIKINVTKELDIGFDSPVVSVLVDEGVSPEELGADSVGEYEGKEWDGRQSCSDTCCGKGHCLEEK